MEFEIWHYWILGAIVFFLLEIFVPSFLMASIGLGCILGFFGSLAGGSLTVQLILFILGTTTGFLGIKPIMAKYAYRRKALKTNASGLIGRIGKVIEEINEENNSGCVAIDGDHWKCIPLKKEVIPVGKKVRVVQLDSIVLTVEPLKENHSRKSTEIEIPGKNVTERLALKLGDKRFFIGLKEIAFLYSSKKITHIVTNEGKQYIHDLSLDRLDSILPTDLFYRINRQFIVTRNVISEIKSESNGKLKVRLKVNNSIHKGISVSRLKAAAFRRWLNKDGY